MERDFMGLNSKDSVVIVKEEAVEGFKDSAFSKASGVQWPLSNKISALPHFMSFKVAQEENTAKGMSDSLASSGFMTMSTASAFDTAHKRTLGEVQNFAGAGQNFAGATMKQQLLGGVPVTAPHSILPSLGSIAGTTEPWFNSKSSGAPAQLTIFYGGTVNVYNDISPEKAQAIMFLAGNGSTSASNMTQPRAQVQVPVSKHAEGDGILVNQPTNTPPSSGLSSPMSGSGSSTNDEVMAVKPTGMSSTPVAPPNIVSLLGPLAATTLIPSEVPQARKASLARFLEKRKERTMSSAPYYLGKKSPECSTPGSNGATFSVNDGAGAGAGASAGAGAGSLSTRKECSHGV